MKVKSLSRVRLFVTPWIAAYQAPPSMGFSRQNVPNSCRTPPVIPIGLLLKYTVLVSPLRV